MKSSMVAHSALRIRPQTRVYRPPVGLLNALAARHDRFPPKSYNRIVGALRRAMGRQYYGGDKYGPPILSEAITVDEFIIMLRGTALPDITNLGARSIEILRTVLVD